MRIKNQKLRAEFSSWKMRVALEVEQWMSRSIFLSDKENKKLLNIYKIIMKGY